LSHVLFKIAVQFFIIYPFLSLELKVITSPQLHLVRMILVVLWHGSGMRRHKRTTSALARVALIHRLVIFLVFTWNQDLRVRALIEVMVPRQWRMLVSFKVETFAIHLGATFGQLSNVGSHDADVPGLTVPTFQSFMLLVRFG